MLEMNEERVKKILGRYDERVQEIHDRILKIYDELSDTDSIIESVSMKKIEWGKEGSVKGGIKKDLTEVMLRHEYLARERERDLRGELYQLVTEEEEINRIWVCFRALRGKEYHYIEMLYVQGMPYKAVELESNVCHKTFETYRRSGIKKILKMYQSEFTNMEIAVHSNQIPDDGKREGTTKEEPYTQLTLNI